jgi:hypothetical protein
MRPAMFILSVGLFGLAVAAHAQPGPIARPVVTQTNDFEMMTWVDVKKALAAGKTTVLIYNGGTEQRGPQAVNGGHTLIAKQLALMIAGKLGNAIVAPVLPYSVNEASADLPGTIGLTGPVICGDQRTHRRTDDQERFQERGPYGRSRRRAKRIGRGSQKAGGEIFGSRYSSGLLR